MGTATADALAVRVSELLAERLERNRAFFEREAEPLARCCHRMAERFARGGRLVALGRSPAARSDARHVAVEFVHPVIVGKRALPAIGLAAEGGAARRAGRGRGRARRHRRRLRGRRRLRDPRRARARPRARLPDDRLRRRRRRVGVRPRRRRPVRAPGAGRDALPRALGAGARLLRPSRPARGPRAARDPRHRRLELPLPVPLGVRGRPRRRARRRPPLGADQGRRGRRSCASRRSATTAPR